MKWILPLLMCVLSACGPDYEVSVINENKETLQNITFTCGDYTWELKKLAPGQTVMIPLPDDATGIPRMTANGMIDGELKAFDEDTRLPKDIRVFTGWVKFIWRPHGDFVSNLELDYRLGCFGL